MKFVDGFERRLVDVFRTIAGFFFHFRQHHRRNHRADFNNDFPFWIVNNRKIIEQSAGSFIRNRIDDIEFFIFRIYFDDKIIFFFGLRF